MGAQQSNVDHERADAGAPPRLAAVAALVPHGSRVADLGTDHAQLPALLLASGRARFCIAGDSSGAALERARRWLVRRGLDRQVELRWASGLRAIDRDDGIDVITIAGLGARAIVRILGDGRLRTIAPRRLVLQPQTETAVLRRWLARRGFAIVAERLAREGRRYYPVVAAEPGVDAAPPLPPPLRPDDVHEVGPWLVADRAPLLRPLWLEQRRRLRGILARARPGPGRCAAARRLRLAHRVLVALDDRPAGT